MRPLPISNSQLASILLILWVSLTASTGSYEQIFFSAIVICSLDYNVKKNLVLLTPSREGKA